MHNHPCIVYLGEPCVDEYYKIRDKWPKEGDKFLSLFQRQVSGGMIANAASVMAGYGISTSIFCRLFQDQDYDFLIDDLDHYHIKHDALITLDKGRNTKCQIFLGEKERTINVLIGDKKPKIDYLEVLEYLSQFDYAYSSIQSLDMFKEPIALLKALYEKGIRVILDNESTSYIKNWREYVPYCYAISMNEHAMSVFGEGMPIEQFEKEILDLGLTIFIETLGSKGCKIITNDETVTIPSLPVDIVDTTGAGDTFNSSFTYGIIQKMSLKEAATFATYAAARSITIQSGRSGVATIEEINAFQKKIESESI